MEVRKTQTIAAPKTEDQENSSAKVVEFVGDVKSELHKINWTTPEELRVYTKIVVGTAFAMGMGIYFIDVIIQTILNGLNHLLYWLG